MKRSLRYLFVYICFALMAYCSSCGTRKRAAYAETTKKGVVISDKKDISTNARITVTETGTTYTPIDPTRPMVLPDGRTSTNTKIQEGEKKTEGDIRTADKGESSTKTTEFGKVKESENETKKPNPWLWTGLTVFFSVVAYLVYRRFTSI